MAKGWKVIFEYQTAKDTLEEFDTHTTPSKVGVQSRSFSETENPEDDSCMVRACDGDGLPYLKAICADNESAYAGFLSYCEREFGCAWLEEQQTKAGKKVWVHFFE